MTDGGLTGNDAIRDEVARQLELEPAGIGDHDDLIALGLDSIRMMKLAGGWRKRGHDVNFALLAAAPTVAAWAQLLAGASPEPSPEPSPEVGAVDEFAPFPLAPMQHAYWVGRSAEQELGGVAAHLYVEFDGTGVEPERLAVAVSRLVAAHPMLRTRFRPDGTQQTMAEPGRPVFAVVDLRGHDGPAAEAALAELRDAKSHQLLAIEDGQVLDVTVTLLADGRTRLHLDVDMLAGDAMSYRLLVADLAELYRGATVPHAVYSYRRYRTELRVDPVERERDREWWQRRLPELPGPPELPTVPEVDRVEPHRIVRQHYVLSPDRKARLVAAAHARGVTPAMALAAVFAETIGGWSARSRFLLNVPLFQREPLHPEVGRLVGDFSSSIMLDVDVSENVTATERARALQRALHDSAAHARYGGLDVLRDLARARGEQVLAPIVYTSALNLGELFAEAVSATFGQPVWIISQGPQVLLDAQVTEVAGGLLLNWDVRAAAFPDGMIDAMFAHYTAAIGRLADGDAGWDAAAAVALPPAQAAVRAVVNATDGPVSGRCLHEGLFAHAATRPQAQAMLWERGSLSYAQLAQRALTVAGALCADGVRAGDAVAVQLPKGPDQIVAVLGVLAAGATYVPIGFDQPDARRAEILRVGEVVATLNPASMAAALGHREPLAQPVIPAPEAIAYVLFTSGSTGVPKGVEVPHRAAMNTIDAVNDLFDVGPADRVLGLSALEFDASVYDIFGMFAAGGGYVALDAAQRGEPTTWVDILRRHRVSILNCVPSMLDMVLETGGAQLGALRAVTLGGDWVGADLARRLARQAPGCRFAGLGGATETAIHSTVCEVLDPPKSWTTVPFGVPLRNVRCRIVGPGGRDCPDWVPGELWVGGANVSAGYRNDPERTAQRFVEHEGLRWYRTGDVARYWPDGTIEFLGRADHQVQLRGYRVELGEVENALRAAPGVRHAVAAVTGTGAPRLVAAVAGASGTVAELLAGLAELLPGYMIPSRVEIVDRMPLTANGKLDRRAVRAMLASQHIEHEFAAPRTDLESAVADIVASVLELDRVGVTEDFFRLGGDSVQATLVIARLREWLDVDHAVVGDLFAARTVAGLAARLAGRDDPDRLREIARLYLEVAALSDEEVHALG